MSCRRVREGPLPNGHRPGDTEGVAKGDRPQTCFFGEALWTTVQVLSRQSLRSHLSFSVRSGRNSIRLVPRDYSLSTSARSVPCLVVSGFLRAARRRSLRVVFVSNLFVVGD